ncbi:type III polyketide synthase [Frigoriglobus tundricola]|uniref:Naringenin-chalcone synthase n=1 Tax=Frigoriglobus tundricola TaxID=2774151 RepID=A0A6M5Z263_9BACT|nr:type III polyketide synthase [Frigoriglobus tundricola]QJW99826.1 Naringenin-chalcone synthase [Frigoriglobus tundricola]
MSFTIHGLGTAHPPDAVTGDVGLALARKMAGPDVRTSTWLGPIYANSGVNSRFQVLSTPVVRDVLNGTNCTGSPFVPTAANDGVGPTTGERMAIYAKEAGPLALRAAAAALGDSAFGPESITHLVTVSCTGFGAPGVDYALITGLGLKPTTQRTHIGYMGCHGALNGLRVANAFATADPDARVLVCAVEMCSLHYYFGNAADKLIANAIFADGAAAVVGRGEPTSPAPLLSGRGAGEVGSSSPWTLTASASCLIPDSASDMAWTVGDHGFEMTLSRRVPNLIAARLRPWLESWLSDNGLSVADVKSWAVHPGGPKILSAVEESLGLGPAALAPSRAVFADYGNMSSPTVLFILRRLRESNAPRPCVALGFGPGLVAEAALFV